MRAGQSPRDVRRKPNVRFLAGSRLVPEIEELADARFFSTISCARQSIEWTVPIDRNHQQRCRHILLQLMKQIFD
ncbi:hypothetical protein UNPF46_16645 [Bradyrhizobium sp. UNPF46]|nr:hypothetical protein UNPF46_16645 [Bradyrhizobium sp. UNPF46]